MASLAQQRHVPISASLTRILFALIPRYSQRTEERRWSNLRSMAPTSGHRVSEACLEVVIVDLKPGRKAIKVKFYYQHDIIMPILRSIIRRWLRPRFGIDKENDFRPKWWELDLRVFCKGMVEALASLMKSAVEPFAHRGSRLFVLHLDRFLIKTDHDNSVLTWKA